MVRKIFSIFKDSPNSFEGQESNEEVILLIRQHLFTVLVKVGLFSLAFLMPIIIGMIFWPYLLTYNLSSIFFFISSIWYLATWLAIFHSLTIYTLNTVIITDRRIVESDQHGLFDRETSELHNERIQDVTAHTNGVIETVLGFGNVTVQTAASERQFIFCRIPNPEKVKDVIMRITAAKHSGIKTTI